jgi:hypothetical protein
VRPQFILCRSDGEPMSEYSYYSAADPDEWDAADAEWEWDSPDKPVHYVMLRVDPTPVARRTYFPRGGHS